MNDICISFYLRANRIHVFAEALRGIGSPRRICFLISADGRSLLMRAHENRDLKSHKVPEEVYQGGRSFAVSSCRLCRILAELHRWDPGYSYRVPGLILRERRAALFLLARASIIGR